MNTQSVNIRIQKVVFHILERRSRLQGVSISLYVRNILRNFCKTLDDYWIDCIITITDPDTNPPTKYYQCKICNYKTDDISDEAYETIKQHVLQAHEL